eukprot:gene12052-16128_t
MPVHSIVIINSNSNLLYFKYFYPTSEIGSGEIDLLFEQSLFRQTLPYWKKANGHKQTITIEDVFIVFERFNDIIIFANGVDDVDEIILCSVIDTIHTILVDLVEGKVTEQGFLNPEIFGKFAVCIDEMMPQGIIETLDAEIIAKLGKMKTIS